MWEIHGLTFLEQKQAAKRLRLQLSLIKKNKNVEKNKLNQLKVFLEVYLEECLVALNGAPFLP